MNLRPHITWIKKNQQLPITEDSIPKTLHSITERCLQKSSLGEQRDKYQRFKSQ